MKTKQKFIGYSFMIFALIFAHVETLYFGSNLFPKTNAEILCDCLSIVFLMVGIILIHKSKSE